MTIEDKQQALTNLREAFLTFMHQMVETLGSPNQKQQAFLRFDEGHMWMQNAIMTYEKPPVQTPQSVE